MKSDVEDVGLSRSRRERPEEDRTGSAEVLGQRSGRAKSRPTTRPAQTSIAGPGSSRPTTRASADARPATASRSTAGARRRSTCRGAGPGRPAGPAGPRPPGRCRREEPEVAEVERSAAFGRHRSRPCSPSSGRRVDRDASSSRPRSTRPRLSPTGCRSGRRRRRASGGSRAGSGRCRRRPRPPRP